MAKLFTMYAGPATWGPKVQIHSVFGESVWCEFSLMNSIPPGPILFQYWTSDSRKWQSAIPGQILKGQSVWLSAKSSGTGGQITISVTGSSIFLVGKRVFLRVPVKRKTDAAIAGLRFSSGKIIKIKSTEIMFGFDPDFPEDDHTRTFTPVDDDGNPIGPSVEVDFGDPNATATGEMVDENGNAVTDPFEIPDRVNDSQDDSDEAPTDDPSADDGGGEGE